MAPEGGDQGAPAGLSRGWSMRIMAWLVQEIMMPENDIRHLASTAPFRYKVYDIPKRSGGTRTIAQPTAGVKALQIAAVRWLEAGRVPIHACATAYCKGRSIRYNAAQHVRNSFLLKMDFRDFFHSIVPEDFSGLLINRLSSEIDEDEMLFLQRLFFWKPRGKPPCLSIGAPSSPFISNAVMYPFDENISEYVTRKGITYTRYADDLTFSGHDRDDLEATEAWVRYVCQRLPYPHLTINDRKTVFASKRYRRTVTGLVLTNDKQISIGRERKRAIRAAVHRFLTRPMPDDEVARIRGWLACVKDVEPAFFGRLERRYGADGLKRLLKT